MESSTTRKWLVTGALVTGAFVGGAALANAASTGSTTTTPNAGSNGSPGTHDTNRPDPATMPNGPGETLLTGDTAAKVTAAAKAAQPGATVIRVETDSEGSPYEAHLRKADGTEITLKFDKDFKVTDTEQGFGRGPGGGHGGPGGGHGGPGGHGGMRGGPNGTGGSNGNTNTSGYGA